MKSSHKIALVASVLLGLGASASMGVQAATATGNFNVVVNLTPKCEINSTSAATGASITDLTFSYTAFQALAATADTSFTVRCTGNLPYSLALDGPAAAGVYSYTDTDTGLDYTLRFRTSAAGVGDGTAKTHHIDGSMSGNQAGTCATATATAAAGSTTVCSNTGGNRQRTVTLTY
ncbi:spore coat protein U domain-containing protein [Ramlibacter tataouinensis]|uniref:Spore coat protein U domain-containing protein n=1 Tax=Ramlibacter tataouinensis (strain ATCC BAA-407 / DSM 14655 / LMG 21543 / TTB310) TaxID=365046 RepID=F5Y049_RAMTT|nr:hypothetical protein [Ramlibacter tataouinensis]AEG94598.1 hypothetical protein Rta_34850 [Ramlibacter tataouinensis TTB310]